MSLIIKCEECEWWLKISKSSEWGACRIYPAVVIPKGNGTITTWPQTSENQGCGKGLKKSEATKLSERLVGE